MSNFNLPFQTIPNDGRTVQRVILEGGAWNKQTLAKLKQPTINTDPQLSNITLNQPQAVREDGSLNKMAMRELGQGRSWTAKATTSTGQPIFFTGIPEREDDNNRYYLVYTGADNFYAMEVQQVHMQKLNDKAKIETLEEADKALKRQANAAKSKSINDLEAQFNFDTTTDAILKQTLKKTGKKGSGGNDAKQQRTGPKIMSGGDENAALADDAWGHFDDDEGVADEAFDDAFDDTGDWLNKKKKSKSDKYADDDADTDDEEIAHERIETEFFGQSDDENDDDMGMGDGSDAEQTTTTTTTSTTTTTTTTGAAAAGGGQAPRQPLRGGDKRKGIVGDDVEQPTGARKKQKTKHE